MKKKGFARKDSEKKKPRKDVRKAEARGRRAARSRAEQSEKVYFRNYEEWEG